jgi:phospholipid/cholesterol/gamma-HCH transport system permease protein
MAVGQIVCTVCPVSVLGTANFRTSSSYAKIESAADMLHLAVSVVRIAVKPPFSWRRDALVESSLIFRRCLVPLIICLSVFVIANGVLLLGNVLASLGAADRQAGGIYLGVLREVCTWITMMVFAGIVGSAMTADLGARRIREELDALVVLGVDPIKSLVAPRLIAVVGMTALLNVFALLFGTFGGMLVTISQGAPLGPFFATFFDNATIPEFAASLMKTTIFGAIIAMVCCHKGLTAKGGPQGVGLAVNRAVVISFIAIGVVNYVFTQTLLGAYPELSAVR